MKSSPHIHALLVAGLNPFELRLARRQIESVLAGFADWSRVTAEAGGLRDALRSIYGYETNRRGDDATPGELALAIDLYGCLMQLLQQQAERQVLLRHAHADFVRMYGQAPTLHERHRLMIDFARQLGASRRQLHADDVAFDRWFDHDAVVERCHRRLAESEQLTEFVLNRLGEVSRRLIQTATTDDARHAVWRQLEWNDTAGRFLLEVRADFRVIVALLKSLTAAISVVPGDRESLLSAFTVEDVTQLALNRQQSVWVQAEAFSLLALLIPDRWSKLVARRLEQPEPGDDLFVRCRLVRMLAVHPIESSAIESLLETASQDDCPSVRQATAAAFVSRPLTQTSRSRLDDLMARDPESSVRAATLVEVASRAERLDLREWFSERVIDVLTHESDPFVLRTALHVTANWIERCGEKAPDAFVAIAELILPSMRRLQSDSLHLPVRRWASQATERIWVAITPEARTIKAEMVEHVTSRDARHAVRLPSRLLRDHDRATVGRTLAVLAQADYGFDLEETWSSAVVRRGARFAFRTWRLLHELWHPSPDKRQSHRHTIGRVSDANFRVPSGILGELSPTKVPGEPLFMPDEQTWRPFLPLVDDVLSTLNQWFVIRPVTFYSSVGITRITPPHLWPLRLRAWSQLTWRFVHFAALRNWMDDSAHPSNAYVEELRQLGFVVEFQPYFGEDGLPVAVDASVTRFFAHGPVEPLNLRAVSKDDETIRDANRDLDDSRLSAPSQTSAVRRESGVTLHGFVPVLAASPWLDSATRWTGDYASYFASAYENSVTHLLLFVGTVFAAFFLRHLWLTRRVRRARRSIHLTIGGWGTRGKSGTERLKAALLNAMGYGLVSKSTGCEAMFLHGATYGRLRELILYRPYDKATIWEHAEVMRMAQRLDAPVFLWECMGLNPAYVNILQHQWSQDDLSTITNAYPDHEDIQGPAGIDVAQAISSFIPPRGTLFTTEMQMRPVLEHQARRLGTTLHAAGWLEAGLLPPDWLDRFPYSEHPDNIALVVRLARELGIEPDFAVKEMADRIVPDLGVLQTFPVATVRTRRLEFSNGMSANERHGCLNNWTRLGFDRHDPAIDPGTWLTTVVNNRADRIARSRVFASVLVQDLQADCHVLIGGNLHGLSGYIREAWNEWIESISLQSREEVNPNYFAVVVLKKMARRMRIAVDDVQVRQTLSVMLTAAAQATVTRQRALSKQEELNRDHAATKPALPRHLRGGWQKTTTGLVDSAEINPELTVEALTDELLPLWNAPEDLASGLKRHGVDDALIADIRRQLERRLLEMTEYQQFAARLMATDPDTLRQQPESLNADLHALLWTWFERKLVIVENYFATGEQLIDRIAAVTPPGFHNRVMGIQNIKGTGLDFVYRWLAWQTCSEACEQLQSTDDEATFRRGLRTLAEFREYGMLSREHIGSAVAAARQSPFAADERSQAQLDRIESNFNHGMVALDHSLREANQQSCGGRETKDSLLTRAVGHFSAWIEEFLDASDAVRRRKQADQIYKDLTDERIGTERAMLELRKLAQRQKGGWLTHHEA